MPRIKRLTKLVQRAWLPLAAALLFTAAPAQADTRLIVRANGGVTLLQSVCQLFGCTVQYGLGDPNGQLFLVTTPSLLNLNLLVSLPGILDVEIDTVGQTMAATQQGAPPALLDQTPINYYGQTVREGYVLQPATHLINLAAAQSTFQVKGNGTVAVIDTGVDSSHPVLQGVLLPGYDFTRNQDGADEKGDVSQSTTAVIDQSTTAVIDQSTTAVIDPYTASQLNQPQYQGFGHGTMVSGVVHLTAPGAMILPLKAFHVDGTGYNSDVIRAIYYAVKQHANVLNMSFSFRVPSNELKNAIQYANSNGSICVAAAGNDGQQITVYPAGYASMVMGIASTSNTDAQSTFTNYGDPMVWATAPGEGVVTLYPFGTYAATWGTSFSTPFVAGTASLLLEQGSPVGLLPGANEYVASQAIAHAKYINDVLGNGRLDVYQAVLAWRRSLGL
jgi:subtilisin family serine protease